MVLFSASMEDAAALTRGRAVLTVLGCGVRSLPGRGAASVLTELRGGVVLLLNVSIVVVVVVEGGIVFMGWGVEIFPGAGGDAVFRALSREVDIFPAGGGEAVLESLREGVGFLPESGAGAVLVEPGLEVVVVFLDGETTVFAGESGNDVFFGCGVGCLGGG